MAFRPYENLVEGVLDNTRPGKVTGWIKFFRQGKDPLRVTLNLAGDCHRDLQGKRFRIFNSSPCERFPERYEESHRSYVDGLDPVQEGEAGDITAGDEPRDYVSYPYIEWYSETNGRVVLELERSQLEILTPTPVGTPKAKKLDRTRQHKNMKKFLEETIEATGAKFGAVAGDVPEDLPPGKAGPDKGKST